MGHFFCAQNAVAPKLARPVDSQDAVSSAPISL